MSDAPPIGQRFSEVYLKRGEPTQDSQRMRRRLAALFLTFRDLKEKDFHTVVPLRLGINIPYGHSGLDWVALFQDAAIQDVLDMVTIVYQYLEAMRTGPMYQPSASNSWRLGAQLIFREENIHYSVDKRGGVHFSFDAEFDRGRAATIAALQDSRYRAALSSFEGAMAALGKGMPDGKAAIRGTFDAAEGLFKLMFANSPRLTAQEASRLEPLLQRAHATDSVATGAAIKLLSAFKDWVDAAHFYRHEPGHEEPVQPPLTLAVQMVSLGASFLRWLAELDATREVVNAAKL
jgi:hypothetical protein